jgi:D-alanyl-D-alanine carboxypeptidase (penicillin-binding protein 5/6)
MVTALVVVREAAPEEIVTVSEYAASTGGGGLDLEAGETYTVHELLQALLMSSSNDAAVALAEHVAGTEAAFVGTMNRLSGRAGAVGSHFVTPHGLDEPGHFSTARDLALFADRLLAHPLLRRIVRTPSVTIAGPRGLTEIENRNVLLDTYEGAIGVKTGFTVAAGDVLVAAARRAGRRLIAVAMGSQDAGRDARRLLDLGFARLRRTVLLARGASVGELVFDPGGSTSVRAARTVRGMADPAALRSRFLPAPTVGLPLRPGAVVGAVTLAAPSRAVARVPAVVRTAPDPHAPPPILEWLGGVLRVVHGSLLGGGRL